MSIQKFCTRDVVTLDENASARDAAQLMRDRHVGALVVTRDGPKRPEVVGVVTDRDLVLKALASHARPAEAPVGSLMSRRVIAVPATASVADTALTMHEEGVRRLLVVDARRGLVGIASLDDLLEALSGEMNEVSQALRTGLAQERAGASGTAHAGDAEELLALPAQALARRWRQISAP